MKDAARLLAYLTGTVILGALLSPLIFQAAHKLATYPAFVFLGRYGFETVFHRALLMAAILLLYPFLALSGIRRLADLKLTFRGHGTRQLGIGFAIAAIPLLCFSVGIIGSGIYTVRSNIQSTNITGVIFAAAAVPVLEEFIFRGLILGVLLRSNPIPIAMLATSTLFSLVHFLKAPEETVPVTAIAWNSGFVSIAKSLAQFGDLPLVLAAFTTLFLLGWILADARVRTRSLWMSMGLHSGWILVSGVFTKIAHRELLALPWLGKSLLVGIGPLTVALVSWGLMRSWLRYVGDRNS